MKPNRHLSQCTRAEVTDNQNDNSQYLINEGRRSMQLEGGLVAAEDKTIADIEATRDDRENEGLKDVVVGEGGVGMPCNEYV